MNQARRLLNELHYGGHPEDCLCKRGGLPISSEREAKLKAELEGMDMRKHKDYLNAAVWVIRHTSELALLDVLAEVQRFVRKNE